MEETADTDSSTVRDYASRIGTAARTMTELLENALTATTIDAGRATAKPERVSLRALVTQVVNQMELSGLHIDLTGVSDVDVWVDRLQMTQVIMNLLTNAGKYGGDEVAVKAAEIGAELRVCVSDNGGGVEPEFIPHLFDRSSRSPSARYGQQRGSGLGLFIVRDLVEANGGSIDYEPGPCGGASFVVTLQTPPP